jgi:transcriptional regulator GlxA family with amidase domain
LYAAFFRKHALPHGFIIFIPVFFGRQSGIVFKQNLGISISDYIREKKIEKATHLLRYSDKPIVDIANYLSFSSQSHFIQIFENYTGLTPKKYRDKYYKSMW